VHRCWLSSTRSARTAYRRSAAGSASSIAASDLARIRGKAIIPAWIRRREEQCEAGRGNAPNYLDRRFRRRRPAGRRGLGVAVLGTALNLQYRHLMSALIGHHAMPPAIHDIILGSLGGALQVAARIPGPTGTALAGAARQSFVSGMDLGLLIACIVVAAAACVVLLALPQRPPPPPPPRKHSAGAPHTVTPPATHPRCRLPARQRTAQALAHPAQARQPSRQTGKPAKSHNRPSSPRKQRTKWARCDDSRLVRTDTDEIDGSSPSTPTLGRGRPCWRERSPEWRRPARVRHPQKRR